MITQLTGTVTFVHALWCILTVQSVGYRIYATPETLTTLSEGTQHTLWTHHAVREDAQELFGFVTHQELTLFELLIGVSGIGPRSALGLLNLADVPTLASAIARSDTSYLTSVSGVGKKTAEKLVLELRDKVAALAATTDTNSDDVDVIEALIEMGYTRVAARDAVQQIPVEITGVSNRLKAALAK